MRRKQLPGLFTLPLLLAVAVIPLIVRLRLVAFNGDRYSNFGGWFSQSDLFSWYKSFGTIALALMCVLLLPFAGVKRPGKGPVIAWLSFILICFGAAIASTYPELAIYGFPNQYEGSLAWSAYAILALYAVCLPDSQFKVRWIVVALLASSSVIAAAGILQFFGVDYWNLPLIRSVVFGAYESDGPFQLQINGGGRIVSTLFHGNYVGSYCAMLMPLTLSLLLTRERKNAFLAMFAAHLLVAALWIGCQSKAGFFAGGVSSLLALAVLRSHARRHWRSIALLPVAYVAIFWVFSSALLAGAREFGRDASSWGDLVRSDLDSKPKLFSLGGPDALGVFSMTGRTLGFKPPEGKGLKLSFESDGVQLSGEDGKPLSVKLAGRSAVIQDKGYEQFGIYLGNYFFSKMLVFCANNVCFSFVIEGGLPRFLYHGRTYPIEQPARASLPIPDDAFTGRGQIWSYTWVLLKDAFWLGRGFGVYPLEMPMNSPVFRSTHRAYMFDKPHNMYLQILHGCGFFGLFAFVGGAGAVLLAAIRRLKLETDGLLAGSALAVVGYLLAGVINDSVVSVAPVFWVMLGLSLRLSDGNQDRVLDL